MRCAWLVAVLGLLAADRVHADAGRPVAPPALTSAEKDDQARALVRKAQIHYSLGKFSDAVAEYQAAFEIHPDAALLYNIAQCYRLDGNLEKALFFYRSYLRNNPGARNREEVETRITDLERVIAERSRTQELPPNTPVPLERDHRSGASEAPAPAIVATTVAAEPGPMVAPPVGDDGASTPVHKKWWLWAIVGGVVVVGAAVAIALATSSTSNGFKTPHPRPRAF